MKAHINYDDDGLTQILSQKYILKNSKRHITEDTYQFEQSIKLTLPLFMTIPVWKRHEYSYSDIIETLNYFSSLHLWQCALLFGIVPSNSAIKIAFSTRQSMVFGSKAIVIKKLGKILENIFEEKPSILDNKREHKPPLPIHTISMEKFKEMRNLIPRKKIDMLDKIFVQEYICWKDIKIIPLWLEKDAILCVRIVKENIFHKSPRCKNSISNMPLKVVIHQECYSGLEECMFFKSM